MLGPTLLKKKFRLKFSNQMEKKAKQKKTKWKWMGRQIKDGVKFGKYLKYLARSKISHILAGQVCRLN